MNDKVKNSIAGKLAVRVSLDLAAAFILLLGGVFFALNREVKIEAEHYAKALIGIYSDLNVYESHNLQRPIDISFEDRAGFFGDYICSWYRVDYLYSFIPDLENNTVTFLSVNGNRKRLPGAGSFDSLQGRTVEHKLSADELEAWTNMNTYAVLKKGLLDPKSTEVLIMFQDEFGNKAMAGTTMPEDMLQTELIYGFLSVALIMFIIVVLLAMLLYRLLVRTVSDPAKQISRKMVEYVSGGKRSAIRLESDDNDEFSMMAGAFNHMTEEMEKYIADIEKLGRERERQNAELDIAYEIQKGILSSGTASLGNCGIRAVMKPAKNIGGDLYDYLELDKSRTLIVVADVSGKGLPSAMLMAVALTLIRQFAKLGFSPAGILKNVNDTFAEENPSMMFVTSFVGIYDSDKGILTYANAGHNLPYLIHDAPVALDGSDGTPLGLFAGEEYKDATVKVVDGDIVFLYTDGVNEAVNNAGEFFGTERLEAALREALTMPKRYCVETVEKSLREFVGDAVQNDDITMLALSARNKPVLELDYDIDEFSHIRELILSSGLPNEMALNLCVAAEECFVNICSYAFDGAAPEGEKILFQFEYSNKVMMRFTDGGKQFDPRNNLPDAEEYDIDTAVGGLGRLIAFTVADSVDYEYKEGKNILTITKSIKS